MDCDQQERRLFQSDHAGNNDNYLWIQKNEYNKLYSNFVHDQNAKVKLQMKNNNSVFKIEEKLLKNGKNYEVNGTFWTWNILPTQTQLKGPVQGRPSFTKHLIEEPSLIFGASKNNVKLQWRVGQKVYKKFKYNPFVSLQTPKDLNDLSVTLGLTHCSYNLSLLTKFTSSIINSADFIHKARIDYAKNQMYLGLSTEITQGLNCKICKSLLGYEFSPKDNFYLRFQTDNIAQLIKGKQVYQQVGIYYLRKNSENLKFGVGVKSVNSIQNYLNLTVQMKAPYHIKGKIDSKLNVCVTVRKQINDALSFAYGIGVSNMFQKRSRIQTGMVLEYNA